MPKTSRSSRLSHTGSKKTYVWDESGTGGLFSHFAYYHARELPAPWTPSLTACERNPLLTCTGPNTSLSGSPNFQQRLISPASCSSSGVLSTPCFSAQSERVISSGSRDRFLILNRGDRFDSVSNGITVMSNNVEEKHILYRERSWGRDHGEIMGSVLLIIFQG